MKPFGIKWGAAHGRRAHYFVCEHVAVPVDPATMDLSAGD